MSSLRGRLLALLVGTAALLLLIIVVVGVALERIDEAKDGLVGEVQVARIAAKDLEVALLDQETGVRGYALSDEIEFLEPYLEGLQREQEAIDTIADAVGGEAEVTARLEAVSAAADTWRADVAIPAGELEAQGRSAEALALLEGGRGAFEEVRDRMADLNQTLADRRQASLEDFDRAMALVVGVGLLSAVLLVAAGVTIVVALRRSVVRPLQQLGDDARAITAGDFEHRIRPVGDSEIRELAELVDLMRLRITLELDEVRQAREELASKAEELQRSNRDLEQFAYVASHDLQEPLRKVAGFCQLLQRRYAGTLDERADEYIHYAVDGAQRMQVLISDLLSFSRVGRTTERFEPVELAEVVQAAWAQTPVPDGGELLVDGTLPEIAGDRALLLTVFANLFGNSMKFAGEGPPVVRVTVGQEGDQWHLTVQDNGIGIDPEFADKIFVIFQRLHTRETYEGTGIGLALCKRIVEFHGGSIRLGESDVGARFDITFPVVEDRDAIGPPPDALVPFRPEGVLR